MPEPIPPVPPSVEQNLHEIRAWMNTPLGQALTTTGVPAALAKSMARHCADVDARTLGEVLIRLSSHLAGTIAEEPETPPWMLTNFVAMAGVELIDTGDADA